MTDIKQALAEIDMHAYIETDTGAECDCGDWALYDHGNAVRSEATFNDHVRAAILATEPMQAIARQAAIGAAVLHEHKTCTPKECRMYSEYGFSWEGYRPMNIVPCRVAAIADALDDDR